MRSLLIITGLWDLAGALRLRRDGQTVDTVVVNKDIRRVSGRGRSRAGHTLRYRFQAAGVVAEGQAGRGRGRVGRTIGRGPCGRAVSPSAPDVNRAADGKELESPVVSLALGVGIGSLFGVLLRRQLLQLPRERRDASGARACPRPRGEPGDQWRIRYRYHDHLN